MSKLIKKVSHDFTIVNNHILRNKEAGSSERGVYCTMVSLPDGWNFSIRGLAKILPDGVTKISTALKKLEKLHYLKRERVYANGKIIDWDYIISDEPMEDDSEETDNLDSEELYADNLDSENLNQEGVDIENPHNNKINNNQINKEKRNNNQISVPPATKKSEIVKNKIAEAVMMTQEEFNALVEEFGKPFTDKCIEILNNYKLSSGKKYKSDYYAIKNWVISRVSKEYPNLLKNSKPVRIYADDENPFADVE